MDKKINVTNKIWEIREKTSAETKKKRERSKER